MRSSLLSFFFNDTATTEIYTLSLHDALPISDHPAFAAGAPRSRLRPLRRHRRTDAVRAATGAHRDAGRRERVPRRARVEPGHGRAARDLRSIARPFRDEARGGRSAEA